LFETLDYNAAQAQGSSLTLAFGINFPGSVAPDVVAIYINDKPVCSGGSNSGGQTSTTASTSYVPILHLVWFNLHGTF